MKKVSFVLSAVVAAFMFAGCASSKYEYTPPKKQQHQIFEKQANIPYEKAWSNIVANLSKDLFVVNNMDKNSGFINADFSVENPSQYVDCGVWQGHFKNLRGSASYYHLGADSRNVTRDDPYLDGVNTMIETSLSGKINILLQRVGNNQSKMSVNIKYVLTGHQKDLPFGYIISQNQDWNVNFSSNSAGKNSGGLTQCVSKGIIEKQILNYIN